MRRLLFFAATTPYGFIWGPRFALLRFRPVGGGYTLWCVVVLVVAPLAGSRWLGLGPLPPVILGSAGASVVSDKASLGKRAAIPLGRWSAWTRTRPTERARFIPREAA